MSEYIGIIIVFILTIIFGVYLGNMERHETQKKCCPYCSCRECCSIGCEVSAMCTEEEQRPFICMK